MNTMSSNDFKQPIKKKEINEDNFNPFTPYGKMKRSSFLKACIILNVVFVAIVLIADNMQKQFNISDNVINTNIALLFISYFVFNVFVVKKRLYDMTLKPILSWVLSVVLLLFGTTVAITYSTGYSILQLLAIVLLFAKSKKTSEDQEVANKKETFIFKNSLKKIYNYILTNKKKIAIIFISIIIVFIIFRLTCYEHRIVKNKVITINKITGKVTSKVKF